MLKVSFVSPMDIKYSYSGTEWHVYEYAKYFVECGVKTEILVTQIDKKIKHVYNYKMVGRRYAAVPKRNIMCIRMVLPLRYHLFIYRGLPSDSIIYLPFSIYDYILNIATKPKGQKYVIGCHGMHLKHGHIVLNHNKAEKALNAIVRIFLSVSEKKNVYYHVVNSGQIEYLTRQFGIPKRNILYVPPMVDITPLKISANKSRRLRVLHIGGADKDSQIILEAISKLAESNLLDNFEFYFIGAKQPKLIDTLESRYKNVHNIGLISDKRKFRVIPTMDVLMVPAYETFSKILIEGLAGGLHILTSTRNAAASDFVRLGVKMTITDGTTAGYVKQLIRMSRLKKRKGLKFNVYKKFNRGIVIKEFDKNVVLPKILDMFDRVNAAD